MKKIDLNCDMGESTSLWHYDIQQDIELLPLISSMNLATGFHAGDPTTMHTLIDAAIEYQVAIGAHPSFHDRTNFGRVAMQIPPSTLYDDILYQLGAMEAFLKLHGVRMHHVKPHGALYNLAAEDTVIAQVIIDAVRSFDPDISLYVMAGSSFQRLANHQGIKTCAEVFADRKYISGTQLAPRNLPNALIEDHDDAISQLLDMILREQVTDRNGQSHYIHAETLCIHSDHQGAKKLLEKIRDVFSVNHIVIQSN